LSQIALKTALVLLHPVWPVLRADIKIQDEQYLVRWKAETSTTKPPLSWHSVKELVRCLEHIQDYLEEREKQATSPHHYSLLLITSRNTTLIQQTKTSRKRKSPNEESEHDRRSSPFDRRLQEHRTPSASRSPSLPCVDTSTSPTIDIYNGVLDADEYGHIFCRKVSLPADCLLSPLICNTGIRSRYTGT